MIIIQICKPTKKLLLFVFITIVSLVNAKTTNIQPILQAWKSTGIEQSKNTQVFYDKLSRDNDKEQFINILSSLKLYARKHPDIRIEVRNTMYEVLGNWLFSMNSNEERGEMVLDAIKKAYILKDNQLNAELFALYADNAPSTHDYIVYNIKALELMQIIGIEHFYYTQNRYYGISHALYQNGDYYNCIKFGKKFLLYENKDINHWNPFTLILQLDLIGSSYRNLNNFDSSCYYYNVLLDSINTRIIYGNFLKPRTIWTNIAKGNIGMSLTTKGQFEKALPLLEGYLNSSIEEKDTLNIALALCGLGDYYFANKKINKSITIWEKAFQLASAGRLERQMLTLSKKLTEGYKNMGNYSNALQYYEVFYQLSESLQNISGNLKYETLSKNMAFENTRISLIEAENNLMRYKIKRNFMFSGAIVLFIFLFFLVRQKNIQHKRKIEKLQYKTNIAQQEKECAKVQLDRFRKDIIHKNKLIQALYKKMSVDKSDTDEISASLLGHTLLTIEEWEKFRNKFDKAYPFFYANLQQNIKNKATPANERLASLIFLQLNNQEIALTLGISKDSVSRSKRRLKALIELPLEDIPLEDFITQLV